jgi:adenine C2-methylase RlmN of 23S rRNA A2503 and tRNA A37
MIKVIDYKQNLNTYLTEHWKYEKVHRLVLSFCDKVIECSVFEHLDEKKNKVNASVEISSMYGCPVGCKYCASNLIGGCQFLTPEEMFMQVKTAIEYTGVPIKDYPIVIVSFSGIGEPSLIPDRIITAAHLIIRQYPEAKFYLASTCVKPELIDILGSSGLPFRSFWVTYIHYDTQKASQVIPSLRNHQYNFKKIVDRLKSFDLCKVKINCVFIKDFNDSNKDIEHLLRMLGPIKDKVIIRITRINPTAASCNNRLGIVNSKRLLEIAELIEGKGFQKHIYFTETNDNFNCGQLSDQYYRTKNLPPNRA